MALSGFSTSARNAMVVALTAEIDAGSAGGYVELHETGFPGAARATLTFGTTSYGAPSVGVATTITITDEASALAGTVSVCRFFDSDANAVMDGSVTVTGGDGDVKISALGITAGAAVTAADTAGTITAPS